MIKRIFIWVAIAPILAACGGPAGQTFLERFAVHEALFAHVDMNQSTTPAGSLPPGSAVYTGVMGMTVDVDMDPQLVTTNPGGDFLAAGDFTINVDFAVPELDGTISNFSADEGHTLSGTLTIPTVAFVGSTFDAIYSGGLMLDGFLLNVTGGTTSQAQFKGPNGEFIWGFHDSVTSYDDGSGVQIGTIDGGFVGQ